MGSIEISDDIASAIKAKKDCLEKAKWILLADDSADSCNHKSPTYIDSLVGLHDSLQATLSQFPLELIYSQFHCMRWPTEGYRYESKSNIEKEKIRETFQLEADLYRSMWLNCLILLSVTNTLNREQHSRKRQRKEVNNPACDGSRKILLQRTTDQCRVLVRLLESVGLDHGKNNIWDERIREWTQHNIDEEDDDDGSLNILSFTKEQLEAEEQQLLDMAETPIPAADRHKNEALAEIQDEIVKLWPEDEVKTAQRNARELFTRIREGK